MSSTITIEGFEILEPIGDGASSHVYRARQVGFDRDVAVKAFLVDFSSSTQQETFARECRAVGRLSQHPNIVTVFDTTITADGQPCIVMQYYPAGSVRDRTLETADALRLGILIAGALHSAHEAGVVHRDVKPGNIFLSEYGEPALGDFGISTLAEELTITGVGGGLTLHYAAPEVIEGATVGPASDIYSLAATLYTLIAGRRPYARSDDQTTADLARMILTEAAPPLEGDKELADTLAKAMSRQIADRPGSAAEFGRQLQAIEARLGVGPTSMITSAGIERMPVEPSPLSGSDDGRRIRSLLVGVASVAAVAITGLGIASVASTADPEVEPPASTIPFGDDDTFFAAPVAPTNVVLASTDEGLLISWDHPAAETLDFEVQRLDTGDLFDATDLSITLPAASSACVVVRAIDADGRISPDSITSCLQ